MNLISCWNCGTVLDANRLDFELHEGKEPDIDSDEYQEWHEQNYVWDGNEYVKCVSCPVCKGKVREDGGMV